MFRCPQYGPFKLSGDASQGKNQGRAGRRRTKQSKRHAKLFQTRPSPRTILREKHLNFTAHSAPVRDSTTLNIKPGDGATAFQRRPLRTEQFATVIWRCGSNRSHQPARRSRKHSAVYHRPLARIITAAVTPVAPVDQAESDRPMAPFVEPTVPGDSSSASCASPVSLSVSVSVEEVVVVGVELTTPSQPQLTTKSVPVMMSPKLSSNDAVEHGCHVLALCMLTLGVNYLLHVSHIQNVVAGDFSRHIYRHPSQTRGPNVLWHVPICMFG